MFSTLKQQITWFFFFFVVLTLFQTTNFRLFQTQGVCTQQFQNWWKWCKIVLKGRKHCGKRRKLLGMSDFSFSKSVFNRPELLTCKNKGLFGKGLKYFNPFPNNPWFLWPTKEGFWKYRGKMRKCWWPAFSPFPTMVSFLSKPEIIV